MQSIIKSGRIENMTGLRHNHQNILRLGARRSPGVQPWYAATALLTFCLR
ncbi:MAG: hypothetical protein OJF62_001288 [Pseudolabrys sp.]|nr:hypothetical protein [Pseudolabrys sp.]